MPRFYVHMQMPLSTTIEVEAANEEAAIAAAFRSDQMPSGICAQCSGWGRPFSVDEGEWDLIDGDDAVEQVKDA
jgi:hypothetical protein